MPDLRRTLDRLATHVGGARVLALPLLRTLAVLAAVTWILLAPAPYQRSGLLLGTVIAFVLYSSGVELALWLRPAATLRLNVGILLVDQAVALLLIHLTGGAASALYLALPLCGWAPSCARVPWPRGGNGSRRPLPRCTLRHPPGRATAVRE